MAFGLYIHWPFCESKCPYCDFNSHVATRIDQNEWVRAYQHELNRIAELTGDEVLTTIFFGGGTPSLMLESTVTAIIDTATNRWRCANDLEISLEANPGSVEAGRFAGYRLAGVNRVSLGIQALDDHHLRALGRQHDRQQALAAITIAQREFDRVNLDLIYARQDQTPDDWRRELTTALAFGTGHLAPYQLTIEDGTVFHRRHAAHRLPGLPDEDRAIALYEITQELCANAGLPAYEVSNHARPGEECRHNLIYWTGGTYAGIGPGAHGRLHCDGQRLATTAIRQPGAWLQAVNTSGSGELAPEPLSRDDELVETIMMGLRRSAGIALPRLVALGRTTTDWPELTALVTSGHLEIADDHLRATATGRLLLNTIIGRLLD